MSHHARHEADSSAPAHVRIAAYAMASGTRRSATSPLLARHRIGGIACLPILVALLLAGCATADPVNFANGQTGYAIKCDLGLNGLGLCYQKAGSLCADHGYSLHDWQGNPLTYKAVEQNLDPSFSSFAAKTILVQCNP